MEREDFVIVVIRFDCAVTMASKCYKCSGSITNSDFVSCAGICQQLFHIKCVGVHKSMLNAVNTCPNIYWFCHDCNSGNRNIAASVDRINESIGLLTKSLSGDLVAFVHGFQSLTENLMSTIGAAVVSNSTNSITTSPSDCSDEGIVHSYNVSPVSELMDQSSRVKNNVKSHDIAHHDRESYKSVVVSNIGKDVTADYLTDYLVDKLNVVRGKTRVSLLLPADRTMDGLKFFQYKITVPEDKYSVIMCPNSWPPDVCVRDFVHKRKIDVVPNRKFMDQ